MSWKVNECKPLVVGGGGGDGGNDDDLLAPGTALDDEVGPCRLTISNPS